MRSLYRLLLLVPLIALALILQTAYERLVPLKIGNLRADHQIPALDGQRRIGQTFNAPYPGLYRVDVHVTKYGKPVDRPIVFHLRGDETAADDLATAVVEARDLADTSWASFTFPPVELDHRMLYFELQSPITGTTGVVGVTAATGNPYTEGHLVLDGVAVESDFHFVAYFKPAPLALADIVLNRMAAKKPGLWGEPRFYVALFAAYLVVTLAFFWRVLDFAFKPEPDRGESPPTPPEAAGTSAEPEPIAVSGDATRT